MSGIGAPIKTPQSSFNLVSGEHIAGGEQCVNQDAGCPLALDVSALGLGL